MHCEEKVLAKYAVLSSILSHRGIVAAVLVLWSTPHSKATDSLETGWDRIYPRGGWGLTTGASYAGVGGFSASTNNGEAAIALRVGVSRKIGRKVVAGIETVAVTPRNNPGELSVIFARTGFRIYPAWDSARRDQFYFYVGAAVAIGEDRQSIMRVGGGPDVGLGVDVKIGSTYAIFLEGSVALLFPARGRSSGYSPKPPQGVQVAHTASPAEVPGMAAISVGMRFGL
jgi:hypothetical protein